MKTEQEIRAILSEALTASERTAKGKEYKIFIRGVIFGLRASLGLISPKAVLKGIKKQLKAFSGVKP